MSVMRERTLSIIEEGTERSESEHSSRYEPVVIPETSRYYDPYQVQSVPQIPRASIFSSETSYGEPLPPGQSTFNSLGISLSQIYDKSLPSLPRGSSAAAKSASARSGQKTESPVRSESSRHSLAKSESSRHSAPPAKAASPSPKKSTHRSESPRHSSAKSGSARGSARSGSDVTVVLAVPPTPLGEASAPSSVSSVTTHTSTSTSSKSSSVSSVSTQSPLRTFDDVVEEVATSLALRTKMRAETVATSADQTKIGVCTAMSRGGNDDERFMRTLAAKLHHSMTLQSSYLFALVDARTPATIVFCGTPQHLVTKASILAGLRFKTRLAELQDTDGTWIGRLDSHAHVVGWDPQAQDEDVLWDIVRKAANPVDPAEPPPGSRSVARILSDARTRLDRLSPREAFEEAMEDGILVDIRPAMQRAEHGDIPGAMIIERNVLEWRFDPRSIDGRLPIADRYDLRVIVYCQEGYTSSLAAASLQDIGLWRATDLDGGFARWKNEGFPTNPGYTDQRSITHRSVTPASPQQELVLSR